ncbi:cytidyltransferase [Prauserella sp. PE36]|uniref:cytidyltransferase n=1 Tax=Prauserella sp. PE36 TaxID=1504709 RepID=UPI000DE1CDA3|nr:cytidyltransferase [Prauserella sp. PE36]RBM11521.1 cytidyltransferase [Prauserella sp. PE36]
MTAPATGRRSRLWRGLTELPPDLGPQVVTIGVFDGVHRGHTRLIGRTLEVGREHRLPTMLVTFDPHPARVVGAPRDTTALSTVDRRAELAWRHGVDGVCVLSFTEELARLSPEAFVERIVVGDLRAAAVVVGANFTFGHQARGDLAMLRRLGARHDVAVHGVDLLPATDGHTPCSSTFIRRCLARGDVEGAARALGRPHRVDGLARMAGWRTGALTVEDGTALPAPGSYRARLSKGGITFVQVTARGQLLIRTAALPPGPAGLDFLSRA